MRVVFYCHVFDIVMCVLFCWCVRWLLLCCVLGVRWNMVVFVACTCFVIVFVCAWCVSCLLFVFVLLFVLVARVCVSLLYSFVVEMGLLCCCCCGVVSLFLC